MKGFAIHNAPTNHGGRIPSTQMRGSQEGNLFFRAGDGHLCPKCKVWSTVQPSHNHVIFDGKPVAYVDDILSCGARILPQQSHVVGDSGSGNANDQGSISSSLIASQLKNIFEDKFKLISQSGEALNNINYQIIKSDGSIENGTTDNNGFTHIVNTTHQSEIISIKATYDY